MHPGYFQKKTSIYGFMIQCFLFWSSKIWVDFETTIHVFLIRYNSVRHHLQKRYMPRKKCLSGVTQFVVFCHHNTRKGFKTMTMMRRPQRSIIILSCSIDWLDALGGADNLSLLLIWYTMETINLIASTSSDPLEKYQGFKVPGGKHK